MEEFEKKLSDQEEIELKILGISNTYMEALSDICVISDKIEEDLGYLISRVNDAHLKLIDRIPSIAKDLKLVNKDENLLERILNKISEIEKRLEKIEKEIPKKD